MRDSHKNAGMITHHHETANWFKGDPDLRPFDTVYKDDPTSIIWNVQDATIGDPSRIGRVRANQKYIQRGAAGQDRIDYKMSKHRERIRTVGPLTQAVDFNPVVVPNLSFLTLTPGDASPRFAINVACVRRLGFPRLDADRQMPFI